MSPTTAFALCFLLCVKGMVEANYVLEVRAHTYQNSEHRDSGGQCCESVSSFGCSLVGDCDNIFTFCLRQSGTPNDDNPANCPLGSYDTVSAVDGGDDISFGGSSIAPGVPNPMTFTGSSVWPGQVQLYIEVVDSDINENDHVDDIYVEISLTPSSFFTSIMQYTGQHGNGMINLSFRVRCSTSFFLDDCSRFCEPTDDSSGHYTCGANGELICLEGWQDTSTNCLTPTAVDLCNPTPCQNGGTCENLSGGYRCDCQEGFTGMNCELEMVTPGPTSETISNLCDSDPCLNGGTCTSSPDGFVCSCTPGFTGLWCENQNTCLPSPCVRGICTKLQEDFQCDCPEGFRGRTCDEVISEETIAATAIIGGGVGAGALIGVLVLGVVILVAALACVKKRKKSTSDFPEISDSSPNPAYDSQPTPYKDNDEVYDQIGEAYIQMAPRSTGLGFEQPPPYQSKNEITKESFSENTYT